MKIADCNVCEGISLYGERPSVCTFGKECQWNVGTTSKKDFNQLQIDEIVHAWNKKFIDEQKSNSGDSRK